jgi:hypothetical protein
MLSDAPLKFKLSSGKLFNFSNILQAFGALMFLLEATGRREKDACASFTMNIFEEQE